ncbi:MAG: hypothetical protein MZW92_19500 [Comamonadaceae bacterium]|nr:hypothetical protein [Comamonadaceae bacterium]
MAARGAGADVRAVLRRAGALRRRLRRRDARRARVMFVSNSIKVVGCLMMLFGTHPLLAYADRRPRRGGLLAGQVRHPHRAAAAVAAGQGQRLDRGPDDRLDHPGRAARRPARRAAHRAVRCWRWTCRCIDTRRRHAARGGDRALIVLRLRAWRRCSTSTSRAPRRRCSPCRATRWRWCATSRAATRGCGTTSSARSRWPRRRCSGAWRATCATSCWPGPRRRWATATTQASSAGRRGGDRHRGRRGAWPRCVMKLDRATARDPAGHRRWACW